MTEKYKDALEFAELLDIPEDEMLQALISCFTPPNPGALAGSWKQRKGGYSKDTPTTEFFYNLQKESSFSCSDCGGHFRLNVDHIDGDNSNHAKQNLRILCFSCHRERRSKNESSNGRLVSVRLYKAATRIFKRTGKWPSPSEVGKEAGLLKRSGGTHDTGGAGYMLKFICFKYGAEYPKSKRGSNLKKVKV